MLPEMDGFEVLRRIRRDSAVPVIMLSARGEVTDRIVGIELGADDYLPKPFEPRELVVRIQSILRRANNNGTAQPADAALRFEHLEINPITHQITVKEQAVELTDSEFRLLLLLARCPGEHFSRDRILNDLHGIDSTLFSRSVDILVSRLRHKLQPLSVIHTHRGSGYSFSAAPPQR
jgi:OmpR family response regulator RpaB